MTARRMRVLMRVGTCETCGDDLVTDPASLSPERVTHAFECECPRQACEHAGEIYRGNLGWTCRDCGGVLPDPCEEISPARLEIGDVILNSQGFRVYVLAVFFGNLDLSTMVQCGTTPDVAPSWVKVPAGGTVSRVMV